jgi:lipopolysaccharide transport system permease protein
MQELIIESGRTERQYWRDLWRYRELFYFLAWRDILVRYKQTIVGVGWSLIRPVLTMLVLVFAFGKVANLSAGETVPYPIVVLCGMLPWQFFSAALAESGGSLVANAGMVSKVYFPRMVVPASSVITSFVDFAISFALLCAVMVYYRYSPGPAVFTLPLFVVLAFGAAFGAGLWLSALMVEYRDFRFIVPFVVQFGLYISPVGFSSEQIAGRFSEQVRFLYSLNPIVGVIDGFRWAILGGTHAFYWPGLLVSVCAVVILIVTGVIYFRRTERTFVDVI